MFVKADVRWERVDGFFQSLKGRDGTESESIEIDATLVFIATSRP
jgi:hypothetical protein